MGMRRRMGRGFHGNIFSSPEKPRKKRENAREKKGKHAMKYEHFRCRSYGSGRERERESERAKATEREREQERERKREGDLAHKLLTLDDVLDGHLDDPVHENL